MRRVLHATTLAAEEDVAPGVGVAAEDGAAATPAVAAEASVVATGNIRRSIDDCRQLFRAHQAPVDIAKLLLRFMEAVGQRLPLGNEVPAPRDALRRLSERGALG
jgi:hypothetical protein